jgi:hypothetical protein
MASKPCWAAEPIGNGCSGSDRAPRLAASLPLLGSQPLVLTAIDRPIAAASFAALAAIQQSLQVAGNCWLYVADPMVIVPMVADGQSVARLDLAIPPVASLRGADLFCQAFAVDASAPIGLAFSNGLRTTVGDWRRAHRRHAPAGSHALAPGCIPAVVR